MADINSSQIAALVASPSKRTDVRNNGGRIRTKGAIIAFDGTQSAADVVRFFRVKSGDVITSLQMSTVAAITGMTGVSFGVHSINGGAAVDAELFNNTLNLASLILLEELRIGAASDLTIATSEQAVYELLGLAEDPNLEYDVTATLVTAGSASNTMSLRMTYTAGD
tara:strand:- start:196 stop:696 length:501 start_codon:yes stop_codon:yes gene_type:complete